MKPNHGSVPLVDLPVLVVDCQATGTSIKQAHLIEVAWARFHAAGPDPTIDATLVALPEGAKIPRRVTQLTGLATRDLDGAPAREEVVRRLDEAIDAYDQALAVAHFARYERSFLSGLRERDDLEFICTHEVVKRLLPGLPRKGLRAAAGYFGRTLDEAKRAGEHVEATVFVWREVVSELRSEGVVTLDDLWRWLEKPPAKSETRTYPLPREKRLALPQAPGVYRMLGRDGTVLYVGKATSLKDRVNSYYRQKRLAPDKMELVSQVWDLDVTVTETALEAALLESDEIKRLSPRYNHALRERPIVWTAADDFRDHACAPSERHTLGPFSSATMCEQFADVVDLLAGCGTLDWFSSADADVVAAGVAAFRAKWDVVSPDVSGIVELGSRIFPTLGDEDEHEVTGVTEETVVRTLEFLAAGAYRSVTRARWLIELSGSRIRWAPHGAPEQYRVLELRRGEPQFLDQPSSSTFALCDTFDATVYDRLSVLLVEIRRILRDGRNIAVETPGRRLDREQLSSLLSAF